MMDFYIKEKKDLIDAIDKYGIVPFFENEIKGFSIEENIDPKVYFGEGEGIWEWKGPVITETKCAYGKFFRKKAAFVSKKWFYDLANYRRDGYDFDARVSDGLANYNEEFLYNIIASRHSILSKTAKAIGGYVKPRERGKDTWEPRKGFDTTITNLQMKGYVLITDFDYEVDKNGEFYGWGIARYATPEEYYGKTFADKCYKRTPEESYERLFKQIKKLTGADEFLIRRFLG
ncbi:MAG: hypothetical protein IKS54_11100 [Erysipelotrichaceae bacterium]|nr:hypothetical protein [Erysipelotrichaceae bacterium]